MSRWTILILCGLGLGGLVLFLAVQFPDALIHQGEQVQLAHALLFVGLIGSAAILHGRFRAREAARHAAAWLVIGAIVLAGYSYRHEASQLGSRLVGELLPHQAEDAGRGTVAIRAGRSGHFVVEAAVNGTPVRFLVDTGASDVTLSPADARRVGFDPSELRFTRTYRTANGTVQGAPVRLDSLKIGSIVERDLRASVNGAEMNKSLLGMSFLARLSGYEVKGDRLFLYP